MHTIKVITICDKNKKILLVGELELGKNADITLFKNICKNSVLNFSNLSIWVDLGFLGIDKLLKNISNSHTIYKPIKKGKNKDLTAQDKKYNRAISSDRVVIEHIFSDIKRYFILKNRQRTLSLKDIQDNFNLAAGLTNFRNSFSTQKRHSAVKSTLS